MPKNIEFSVITFSLVFDGDFSNLKAAHALYMTSSVCDAQPSWHKDFLVIWSKYFYSTM